MIFIFSVGARKGEVVRIKRMENNRIYLYFEIALSSKMTRKDNNFLEAIVAYTEIV